MLKLTGRWSFETPMASLRSLVIGTPMDLMNASVKSKLFTLISTCLGYLWITLLRLWPGPSTKRTRMKFTRKTLHPTFKMMERRLLKMSRPSPLRTRTVLLARKKSQRRLWTKQLLWTSLSFVNFIFYLIVEIMLRIMVV